MHVTMLDPATGRQRPCTLSRAMSGLRAEDAAAAAGDEGTLYLGPPWIDSHCHVFDGIGFGLSPDLIGYRAGVHLLVDAGSAGVETLDAFLRYVVAPARTRVMAFLNVSAVGLATLFEYIDARQLRVRDTAVAIREHPGLLAGVKVRSSGYVTGAQGLLPLHRAVAAAELSGCPIMIHVGEAPPTDAENLPLLRGGDILTHCFHGKQAPKWRGRPLWNPDGTPSPPMAEALSRGVALDVGHGEASFCAAVAAPVIERGEVEFSISTDLHGKSYPHPVYSLAVTMSKFLALGMPLCAVLRAVTEIPARRLGLAGWCADPMQNGTLFQVRPVRPDDPPFVDAERLPIDVRRVIEPVAVVMEGAWTVLDPFAGDARLAPIRSGGA